ncbi:unnamed protein product [Rhizophagus irregularis]|nr:unnamed protein product [Rhizophagus irregularis]
MFNSLMKVTLLSLVENNYDEEQNLDKVIKKENKNNPKLSSTTTPIPELEDFLKKMDIKESRLLPWHDILDKEKYGMTLIVTVGIVKCFYQGHLEYFLALNNDILTVADFNQIPLEHFVADKDVTISTAGFIFDLLQKLKTKTLCIVDNYGALFELKSATSVISTS